MNSPSAAPQGELRYSASRCVRIGPQPPPVGIDVRPADRRPHSYSAGFRRVEGLEDALEMLRIDTRASVAHCYGEASCLGLLRADRRFSWPFLNRPHCFDRIQNQVQDDLLQMNTISLDGKRLLRKVEYIPRFILREFPKRVNTITSLIASLRSKTTVLRRRFVEVAAGLVDDDVRLDGHMQDGFVAATNAIRGSIMPVGNR